MTKARSSGVVEALGAMPPRRKRIQAEPAELATGAVAGTVVEQRA